MRCMPRWERKGEVGGGVRTPRAKIKRRVVISFGPTNQVLGRPKRHRGVERERMNHVRVKALKMSKREAS